MMKIDLHLHSSASDGSLAPRALLKKASEEGFSAVALADHDTLQGVGEAREAARELGLCFLPAVELSVGEELEIHLLGYGVDENAPALQGLLAEMLRDREERVRKMAQKLRDAGYPVDYERVRSMAGGAVGRPHLARALVEAGAAASVSECFQRWIGRDAPFYVPRKKVSTRQGIRAVLEAGGVPVLAHPGQLRLSQQALDAEIGAMQAEGLRGLECYHNAHDPATQDWLREACKRRGLLVTGGSDFHGAAKPKVQLGSGLERWRDAEECLDALLRAVGEAKRGR